MFGPDELSVLEHAKLDLIELNELHFKVDKFDLFELEVLRSERRGWNCGFHELAGMERERAVDDGDIIRVWYEAGHGVFQPRMV